MQHSPHDIKEKLLKALDKDYNVVDMPVVVEIIGILERTPITKEDLETTRLGKYVNELRRKTTNEQVAKRAKDLVRKWRDMITTHTAVGTDGGAGRNQNGTRPPPVGPNRIVSPAIGRSLSPGSWNRSCPISPALSLKRSQPSSPASKINSVSPDLSMSPSTQRHSISPAVSPQAQVPSSKSLQLPHASGDATSAIHPPGTPMTRIPEQSTSTPTPTPGPRPRGRPPLNRTTTGDATQKSPSRPRGRPPLDHSDGEVHRGRGRPPLDPSRAGEHRGRGRPPLSSSPTGAPRGRGRPPKNKNKLKNLTASESNQNSNLVPKTSPANKRLRKSSEEDVGGDEAASAAKKQKLNGVYDCKVPDIVNSNDEKTGLKDPSQVPSEQIKIPKKRGRKKGSKNAPKNLSFDRYEEDVVKEKMASIVRNPKVKTTRELLECIQKESSLDNLRNKTWSSLGVDGEKTRNSSSPGRRLLNKSDMVDYDMTLSKTEHIHKFLRSQNEAEDDFGQQSRSLTENDHRESKSLSGVTKAVEKSEPDSKPESRPLSRVSDVAMPATVPSESSKSLEILETVEEDIIDVEKVDSSAEDSPAKSKKKTETVEEILAKLPIINPDDILWSESETRSTDSRSMSSNSRSSRSETSSESGSNSSAEERVGEYDEEKGGRSVASKSRGRRRKRRKRRRGRRRKTIVTEEDVDRLLSEHIAGVNGNWNEGVLVENLNHGLKVPIGDVSGAKAEGESGEENGSKPNSKPNNWGTDEQLDRNSNNNNNNNNVNNNKKLEKREEDNFREWQECVSKISYNGELLHILPYVIID